jgi:hypothetical protein
LLEADNARIGVSRRGIDEPFELRTGRMHRSGDDAVACAVGRRTSVERNDTCIAIQSDSKFRRSQTEKSGSSVGDEIVNRNASVTDEHGERVSFGVSVSPGVSVRSQYETTRSRVAGDRVDCQLTGDKASARREVRNQVVDEQSSLHGVELRPHNRVDNREIDARCKLLDRRASSFGCGANVPWRRRRT